MISDFIKFVQGLYGTKEFIPLHAPVFNGKEKEYLNDAIDSTFVSSVSDYVIKFEELLCEFTGSKYAIPVVNGTSALHLAMHVAGVDADCEVLTQSLTFAATCNAVAYTGAQTVFIDIDPKTLGLDPDAVDEFLQQNAELRDDGFAYNKHSKKRIAACVPMHTFGHPLRIQELAIVCKKWSIPLIEDAAEALGSYLIKEEKIHCGTLGQMGVLSFNGNKVITTGGGGAILTDDDQLAAKLRYLSTTAKKPHAWEYAHDEVGFNYRMPGLNAALGCAQMQQLAGFLQDKREIAAAYEGWAKELGIGFISEPDGSQANYWLNALLLEDKSQRDEFLAMTNKANVMTRPVWEPMHKLPQFADCQCADLQNTAYISDRLVNVPSSPRGEL